MTAIAIDDTGKLEIPLEIRQQLGITTAQSLNLEVRQGCIIENFGSETPSFYDGFTVKY